MYFKFTTKQYFIKFENKFILFKNVEKLIFVNFYVFIFDSVYISN